MKKPEFANNQTIDSAKMSQIMLLIQVLKTIRLIVIILFLSFFTGSVWYIFSEYGAEWAGKEGDNFLINFDLLNTEASVSQSILLTYFSFTTLSTVGLGDFYPKSSSERILCSFIMMFGVLCTSLLMDNLSEMIKRLRNFNKPYDETQQLNLFLGTLRKFNDNVPVSKSLENKLDKYFHYRWYFNRNLAISTEADKQIYDELPGRIQTELFVDFLFKSFIERYRSILEINQTKYEYKRKSLHTFQEEKERINFIS